MKAVILVGLVLVTTFSAITSLVTNEGSGLMSLDEGTVIGFLSTSYVAGESTRGVVIQAGLLRGELNQEVHLRIQTTSLMGQANTLDYLPLNTVELFSPNETLRTILITILDDSLIEGNESFTVSLEYASEIGPDDLSLGPQCTTVTIIDDEFISIGFRSSRYVASESIGPAQLCLLIVSVPSNGSLVTPATFSVMDMEGTAMSPMDYELLESGDIIIPSTNITTYCIDMAIYDDDTPEPGRDGKNFTLILASSDTFVEFSNPMATITIHDNDVSIPTITIDPIPGNLTGGQQLAIVCRVKFDGGIRYPINIEWLNPYAAVVNGSSIQISGTVQTPTSGVSTLTFPSLFVSQAGLYTCRGTVDTYVFGTRIINRVIPLTVQIAPVSVFLSSSPSRNILIGQNVSITCAVGADASTDLFIPPTIIWDVSYMDDGELIMDTISFGATEIVYITEAVFGSTLHYTPILRDMNFNCSAFVRSYYAYITESESTNSSLSLDVQATCPEEVSRGILWPRTIESNEISLPCTQAGSRFRAGTSITRTCQSGGVWNNEVDFTSCTLDSTSSEPFLIVYFSLVDPESSLPFGSGDSDEDRPKKIAIDIDEETLIVEMEDLLRGLGVTFTMVTVTNIYNTCTDTGLSISFEIVLSDQSGSLDNFITNGLAINGFAGYPIDQNAPIGFMGVVVADSCQCGSSSSDKSIGSGLTADFLQLCAGLSLSPCNCTSSGNCQCRPPYVGDGSRCTLDSDGDEFPDLPLDSPVCIGAVNTPYCIQDVCPTVHNIDQDPAACQPVMNVTVFTGCPFGPDPVWSIEWPNTERDTLNIQRCPGELDSVTGQATRYCDNDGVWSEPDVLECQDMQFVDILDQASFAFSLPGNSTELVQQTVDISMQLADITEPDVLPLLPTSLNTTNEVLSGVLNVLEDMGNDTAIDANEFVIDVFNNVLERNNTQGWMALQTSDEGSQVLLDNAERFGVLLARSQNNSRSTEPQRFSRSNIAISAKQYDSSQEVKMDDLKFPQEEDLVNYSLSVKPVAIQIPPGLLQERLSQHNGKETGLPIVFILFQNLEAFLPSSVGGLSNNTHGASVVISSQVGERGATQRSQLLEESPLSLNFTFDTVGNVSKFRCVYWNFSEPVGNGEWISEGVSTVGNSTDDLTSTVQCASTHLTCFAVLVDVAGGLQGISQAEGTALQVVSYIGCVISVICLLISVIFFLFQGKKLLTSVHYFVHLNLSISLLLAYFVFIVGVETAVGNVVGCAFVAALLHYLFLSSFCWMMCEGVMLYLLLVVVFSRVAKMWWFFLLLGYLIPIPFVVITLAVRWQYYGVRDTAGNLQFCWLSTDKGTIFGFVAPMLIIMMINAVFIGFALRTLWKNKRSQVKRKFQDSEKSKQSLHLAKSILLASIILLPLLGLTWVFGLLTVNSNTTFFAWIFTILNSLQGVAIFFFHVVRSDKIRGKIGPKLTRLKLKWSDSTAVTLKRYRVHYREDTTQSDRDGFKTKSTTEDSAGYSMGTLKSSLSSQDEMLKPDLSSSASGHYSHSEEYTETKLFGVHDKPVPFDETVQ